MIETASPAQNRRIAATCRRIVESSEVTDDQAAVLRDAADAVTLEPHTSAFDEWLSFLDRGATVMRDAGADRVADVLEVAAAGAREQVHELLEAVREQIDTAIKDAIAGGALAGQLSLVEIQAAA